MTRPFMDRTIFDALAEAARTAPDKLAYVERGEGLSYEDLLAAAEARAAAMAGRGVSAGDRVAICLPAGLEFMKTFWAVQRVGAASVAFHPGVPPATIAARVARVRPALFVTPRDSEVVHAAASRGIDVASPDDLETQQPLVHLPAHPEIAFLQPTSGTTGESRAVMVTHRALGKMLAASAEALEIRDTDVFVSWVPPWHDLGLVRFVIGTVYSRATCHIVQPAVTTIPEWLETIGQVGGTLTGAPDFAYRLATRLADPARVDLHTLRFATNGGEPVRRSTIEAFEKRFGIRGVILPGYGLAEATLGVATLRPGEELRSDARGTVSCGRAMPGIEITIDGAPEGEILVRSETLSAGYFDAPEATADLLRDGWLHTGDIGHLDGDGHLYVLGRKRAMIKRGGAILAPRELEEAVQSVKGVSVAAAVAIPATGDASTEQIALVVEADAGADAALVNEVAEAVRRAVGFAPDRIVLVRRRTIPRTYNGKIRYDALRTGLVDGTLAGSGAILLTLPEQ